MNHVLGHAPPPQLHRQRPPTLPANTMPGFDEGFRVVAVVDQPDLLEAVKHRGCSLGLDSLLLQQSFQLATSTCGPRQRV